MKRVVWFVSGAVAGVAGASYAKKKVKETASQLSPTHVAKTATAKARQKGHDVAQALREGREAKRSREADLWAKLAPAEPAGPAKAGDIIVTSEVREVREVRDVRDVRDNEQVGPRRSSRRARRGP